jgi:hypothetical protein
MPCSCDNLPRKTGLHISAPDSARSDMLSHPNPPPNAPSLQAFGDYPTPSGFRSGVLAHGQPTSVAHRLAAIASTGIDRAHARQDVCGDPRGRDKSRVELLEVVERVTTERSEGVEFLCEEGHFAARQYPTHSLACVQLQPPTIDPSGSLLCLPDQLIQLALPFGRTRRVGCGRATDAEDERRVLV